MLFSACQSTPKPKPLDLTTITEEIPISSVNLFIRSDVDVNGQGKEFIKTFYTENIGTIKEMLIDKGIRINDGLFLEDFENDPAIGFSEINFGMAFTLYNYSWDAQNPHETHAMLSLNFIIREDGTMPLDVTISKTDPEYKPGYEAKTRLNLRFEPK
jgi:hypothetical protein